MNAAHCPPCLSVIIVLAIFSFGQVQDPASDDERVDCPTFQLIGQPYSSAGGLSLPDPIGQRELQRYRRILQLSEAQAQAMERLYQTYCQSCMDLKTRLIDPLWKRAAQLKGGSAAADEKESLRKDTGEFIEALTAREAAFFDALFAMLSEQQQASFTLARVDRSLQICSPAGLTTAVHPEARIDLVRLLDDLELSDDQHARISGILAEYVQVMAPRICDRARSRKELLRKEGRLMESYDQMLEDKDPVQTQIVGTGILEQRQQLLKDSVTEDRRTKEMNLQFLHRFEEALDDDGRERLRSAFDHNTYPQIYPDSSSAEPAIESLLSIEDLTVDQRAAMEAMAEQYRWSYDNVCREMEEHITKYLERRLGGGGMHVDEIEGHEQELAMMKAKRASLQAGVLKQMMDVLTPEQKASLPKVRQVPRGQALPATQPSK